MQTKQNELKPALAALDRAQEAALSEGREGEYFAVRRAKNEILGALLARPSAEKKGEKA